MLLLFYKHPTGQGSGLTNQIPKPFTPIESLWVKHDTLQTADVTLAQRLDNAQATTFSGARSEKDPQRKL